MKKLNILNIISGLNKSKKSEKTIIIKKISGYNEYINLVYNL